MVKDYGQIYHAIVGHESSVFNRSGVSQRARSAGGSEIPIDADQDRAWPTRSGPNGSSSNDVDLVEQVSYL